MSPITRDDKPEKDAAHQPKPGKAGKDEALSLKAKPRKSEKPAKNGLDAKPIKTAKKTAEQKKPKTQGGEKKKPQVQTLTEAPQYEGSYELIKLLGPVFGPDHNPADFVSRINMGTPGRDPVIEMKSKGPAHNSNSSYRQYGMVERLSELALTLQFRDEVNRPAGQPEVPLRELKAGHTCTAGNGWVVTEAIINEADEKARIRVAKEKAYGILSIGQTIDGGDFKVRLDDVYSSTGTSTTHPAIMTVLDANDQLIVQIKVTPGNTYTLAQSGTGKSVKVHVWQTTGGFTPSAKWAEVSILSEERTLEHGKRYDSAPSDDPLWGHWFVAAGSGGMKKNGQMDYGQGIDFSSNTLSIYTDNVENVNSSADNRYKSGDKVIMPLGYDLRCDGMVNDWKTNVSIRSESNMNVVVETKDGNKGETLSGTFIKIVTPLFSDMDLYGNVVETSDQYLYFEPKNDGTPDYSKLRRFAGASGHSYKVELETSDYIYQSRNGALQIALDAQAGIFRFFEMARPDGANVSDPVVTSTLSWEWDGVSDYRFKKSDIAPASIWYYGLNGKMNSQYELPFTTERGSQWKNIGMTEADFQFNMGGNEPGMTNDGMARFKWSAVDMANPLQFENPTETTDGRTKNGIDGYWRYPGRYVIPSKFNALYMDGIAEYWALSRKGTVFNFVEQQFKNWPEEFAYKVKPKNGAWVEGQSYVPIMGKEYLLTKKDDANRIWWLTDENGDNYVIDGNSNQIGLNGPGGIPPDNVFYGFKPYIGDCANVEDITSPDKRSGNDVLWLKKDVGEFVADAGPQNINPTTRMELDQQPRTQSVGLEIVTNKSFHVKDPEFDEDLTMQEDAVKINLKGMEGLIFKLCRRGTGPYPPLKVWSMQMDEIDELYILPAASREPIDEKYDSNARIIYKIRGADEFQYGYMLIDEKIDFPNAALRFIKPQSGSNIGPTVFAVKSILEADGTTSLSMQEPFPSQYDSNITRFQMSETEMTIQSEVKNGKITLAPINNTATYSLSQYEAYNSNSLMHTILDSYTANLTDTKYNAKGTEVWPGQFGGNASAVTFKPYDNETYPTRFKVLENYIYRAPLETTDGKTKNGIPNYLFPNLSIIPSQFNDQYINGIEQLHLYSADGTTFGPHYASSGKFENRPNPMALKVMPKNAWVEGESLVPVWGTEMLLTKKDDSNKRWEVQDANGTTYALMDGKEIVKVVNGQDVALDANDPLREFKAWIGDCERVDKLNGTRTGTDVMWLEVPERLRMLYTSRDMYTIAPNSKLGLEEPLRNRHMGLEVVSKVDLGGLGQRDAIKIDLSKWTGGKIQIQYQDGMIDIGDVEKFDELYYVPIFDKGSWTENYVIAAKEKGKTGLTAYGEHTVNETFLQITKGDSKESALISHYASIGEFSLVVGEPFREYIPPDWDGKPQMVAETRIDIGGNDMYSGKLGFGYDRRRAISMYQLDNGTLLRDVMEEAGGSSSLQYTITGTKVAETNNSMDFAFFDNFTDPTHWKWDETRTPYLQPAVEPIHEFDFTDGKTRVGLWGKIGKDDTTTSAVATYENYSKIPSKNQEKYDALGIKAFYEIYSPDGTLFDSETNTITNTPAMMSYHMSSDKELVPEISRLPIKGSMFMLMQRGVYDVEWLLANHILKEEDINPGLRGQRIAAWAVGRQNPLDENKFDAYLLASGLPALKFDEKTWKPIKPDDPVCLSDKFYQKALKNNLVVIGEADNMFDVLDNKADLTKDALWLIPMDLMSSGTSYAPGDAMDWGNDIGVTLKEKARDLVKVDLVKQEFSYGGSSWGEEPAYRIHIDNQSGAPGDMSILAEYYDEGTNVLRKHEYTPATGFGGELFVLPGVYNGPDKRTYGMLFDPSSGARGYDNLQSLTILQNGLVVGKVEINNKDFTTDSFLFKDYLSPWNGGQPPERAFEMQTRTDVHATKVNTNPTSPDVYRYEKLDFVSPSLDLSSDQYQKSRLIPFDKQQENATQIPYTNKGTSVQTIGPSDNIQGLTFGIYNNLNWPVYWDLQEPYVEFKEGKGLSNWNWLASPSFIENVYPNPVTPDGTLNIRVTMAMPGRVHFDIIDQLGRPVKGGEADKGTLLMPSERVLEIPLAPLGISRGMYILRLHPENANEFFDAYAKFIVK